jgi:hypothetical protein
VDWRPQDAAALFLAGLAERLEAARAAHDTCVPRVSNPPARR